MASLWLMIFWLSVLCLHGTAQKSSAQEPDFECVDIYKQPAFQHPMLKRHKIQMKPSDKMMEALGKNVTNEDGKSNLYSELKDRCPDGQVPIQKAKVMNQNYHIMTPEFHGQHFAALETKEDAKNVYIGAGAAMSIHAPPYVARDAYSRASIWVEGGPTSQRNSIQFGWAIHPRIYGDDRPRLTVFWTADGYKTTGCYNTLCPGFIQIDKQVYLGMQLLEKDSKGNAEEIYRLSVTQDVSSTGNWMLMQDAERLIGYWPKDLFTHLNHGATFIRYGGNVFGSPGEDSPPMGNAYTPFDNPYDYGFSGFFRHCRYTTQQSGSVNISRSAVHTVADVPKCYNISYYEDQIPEYQQMFAYGGYGGKCGS